MDSDPGSGDRIRNGGTVDLTVSRGSKTVKVPDLSDTPLDKAKSDLKKHDLEPGMTTRKFSDQIAKGSVISTDPGAGETRKAGSAVVLVVSKGSPSTSPTSRASPSRTPSPISRTRA